MGIIKRLFIKVVRGIISNQPSFQRGVSLLEVGLVFAVSSSIIIGVIGGRQVIENAKLNRIIDDVSSFTRAIEEFEAKFGFVPGDIPNFNQFYSTLPDGVNGNGNGSIEKGTNEEFMFWYHLSRTNILPLNVAELNSTGTYEDQFLYVPAEGNNQGSVPAGPIDNSRYRVQYNTQDGFYFELSRYIPASDGTVNLTISSTDYAIIGPRQLWSLDTKYDDGKPNSGKIRAVEQINTTFPVVNANDCIATNGEYNLATEGEVCVLRLYAQKLASKETAIAPLVCDGASVGVKRINSSILCPTGTEGKVYDVCQDDASWKESYDSCLPATCEGDISIGTQRIVSCPDGYSGRQTEECSVNGTWLLSGTCNLPQVGASCTDDITLACPRGETGSVKYTCTGGVLGVPDNSCSTLSCGGTDIGEVRLIDCPTDFSGKVKEVCTYDSRAGQEWKPINNSCSPDTGPCSYTVDGLGNPNNIRDLACPPGEDGTITQVCSASALWVTETMDCQRIECSEGYYVGDSRVATNFAQCATEVGEALEICSIDINNEGEWVLDTSNCVDAADLPGGNGAELKCDSVLVSGHLIWPETVAGQTAVSECSEGYESPDVPSRQCLSDGSWASSIDNECTSYSFDDPDYYWLSLRLWLDAADPANTGGVLADSAGVSSWVNRANDEVISSLTQSDSALEPVYQWNVQGGNPAIYFSNQAHLSSSLAPAYGGEYSVFIVADLGAVGGTHYFADVNGHYWLNNTSSEIEIGRDSATFGVNTGAKTGWHIYYLVNDNDNDHLFYMDNSLVDTQSGMGPGDYADSGTILGASRFTTTTNFMEGHIGEVIVYDRELTDTERDNVYNYLKSKWGL